MKNMKWIRFIALSLLFFLSNFSVSIKAQNPSTPINLEGTKWEGLIFNFNISNGLGSQQHIYIFEKESQVALKLVLIQPPPPSFAYNAVTGKYEPTINVTPVMSETSLEVGKYEVKGQSIHIEFSDHTIDAVINGNFMKGDVTNKRSGKKEEWMAKGILKVNNNSSPSTVVKTSYPNVVRDVNGKFSPAIGFRWANPCGLNDFRVEPAEKPYNNVSSSAASSVAPRPPEDEAQRARKQFDLLTKAKHAEESQDYNEALESYTAAIRIDPTDVRLYFWRAKALFTLQNYRGAISDYDRFIDIYLNYTSECKAESQKNNIYVPFAVGEFSIENAYYNRGLAKEKYGFRPFACIDFRKSCSFGRNEACERVKQVCN
jgi:hypothetical protein